MKHRFFRTFLILEAILCVLLAALGSALPDLFPALSAFPFAHLGKGLRALSLSGEAGNVVSIILYAAVCLIPAAVLLPLRRSGRLHTEDTLLFLTTLALFPVLWLMVNPGHLNIPGSEGVYCAVVWSLLAAWLVLRVLRSLFSADREQLALWFSRLLRAAAVYYVFELCGILLPALMEELSSMLPSGDPWVTSPYTDTEVFFTVLKYAVGAIPSAATLPVLLRSVALSDLMKENAPELTEAASRLSRLSGIVLAVSVLSSALLNLLQLLLHDQLLNIHITITLPVMELLLVLGVLLITRYIAENRRLQEDNDLFI